MGVASGCQGKPKHEWIDVTCPNCGASVEMLSSDIIAECEECGATVLADRMECVTWCKEAKSCVGEEIYNKIMSNPELIPVDLDDLRNFMKRG